ncbi:hypothetical protein A9995_15365 [Erythrobacter sp. QSSC1-22B]|uniref:lysylphosphatidylglycerol synthase transmembrane domain-containing protein n=1 Tax=Erythrobacter sp. QSSC1-22B TaxID=1860125 RepID=UPI0008056089|nr:lysylphosphatidylglycerol synthase transmembrane domain-containing protein [Erythrobacter sp. QSSC1-22B]OBX17624.1 hypothetical protein A9995_15365 [Erythrobacter sp. QSSC1-22B]
MIRFSTRYAAQLALGIAVTALFVWLIARNVNGAELMAVLRRANPVWIAAAIGLFLAGYACRVARWRSMLLRDNPALSWGACVTPFMGSIAANNVLPFRAGDVLRVYGLSGHLEVPKSALLASLLVERLLDLFSLLVVLAICLLLFEPIEGLAGTVAQLGVYGVFALALVIITLLLFPRVLEWPSVVFLRMMSRILPSFHKRIGGFFDHLFETLRHLAQGTRMSVLLLWSVFVWGFEGLVFWASARAIPDIVEPLVGFLALPVATLATMLPSTPGHIGTFDFFAIKSAEALGNSAGAATAFALLVHLVLWLPATMIGGAGLGLWSIRGRGNFHSKKATI